MPSPSLHWEDVTEGAALPSFTYELSLLRLIAFCRASGLYDYVHIDGDYAKAVGARGAFISTPHVAGLFGRLMTDWAGPEAEIQSLTFSMRTQSCAGDMLTVTGKVGRKYRGGDGAYLVDIVDMNIAHPVAAQAAVANATLSLPSRTGDKARMLASPAADETGIPDNTPDFARPYIGTSQASGHLPARPLTKDEIHLWCEALEDWNPLYWDDEYADASRHGGIVSPPTGFFFGADSAAGLGVGYMKPGKTIPAGVREGLTGVPLLQSLRQSLVQAGSLVQPPDCPEIAVVQAIQRYYVQVRPGDTLRGEVVMKGCSPKKSTKLGDGYFITSERRFFNQRNELARSMGMSVFHYGVR